MSVSHKCRVLGLTPPLYPQSLRILPADANAPAPYRDAVLRAASTAEMHNLRKEGMLSVTISTAKVEMLSSLVAQQARAGVSIGSVVLAPSKPPSPMKQAAKKTGVVASSFEKANVVAQRGVEHRKVLGMGSEWSPSNECSVSAYVWTGVRWCVVLWLLCWCAWCSSWWFQASGGKARKASASVRAPVVSPCLFPAVTMAPF